MSGGEAWFAPKRYGYGAGLPIRRQGWLLLAGYFLALGCACLLIPYTLIGFFSVVIILTVPFVVLTARTTRGGWRWRWGKEE